METIINKEPLNLGNIEKLIPLVYSFSTARLPNQQNNEHKKTEPQDNILKSRAIKQGKLIEYENNNKIKKIKQSLAFPENVSKTTRIVKSKIFIVNKKKHFNAALKRNNSTRGTKTQLNIINIFEDNIPENKILKTENNIQRKNNSKEPRASINLKNNLDFFDISNPKPKNENIYKSYYTLIDSPIFDYSKNKKLAKIESDEKMPLDTIRRNRKIKKEIEDKKENINSNKNEEQISKKELFSKTFSKLQTNSIKFLDKKSINTFLKIKEEKQDNDTQKTKEEKYNNNYIYDMNSNIENDKNDSLTTNTKINEENNEESNPDNLKIENKKNSLIIGEDINKTDNLVKINENSEENLENNNEEKLKADNIMNQKTKENEIDEEIIDNKKDQDSEILSNKNECNEKLEKENNPITIKQQENEVKDKENKTAEEIPKIKEIPIIKEEHITKQQEIKKENEKTIENMSPIVNQDIKITKEENNRENKEIKEKTFDEYVISDKIPDSNIEDKENINDINNSDSLLKNDEINIKTQDKELDVNKMNNLNNNNNQEVTSPILKQNELNNILIKKSNVSNNSNNNKLIPKYNINKNKSINQKLKAKSNKNLIIQKVTNPITKINKENITSHKGNRTTRKIHFRKKNSSLKSGDRNTNKKSTSCNTENLKTKIYKDLKRCNDLEISNIGRIDKYNKESLKSHSDSEIDNDDDIEVKDEFDLSEKKTPSSNEIMNKLSSHILTASKKNENSMLKSPALIKENKLYCSSVINKNNKKENNEFRRTSGEAKIENSIFRDVPVPNYNMNLINQINRSEIEIQRINTKIKEIRNKMKTYDGDIRKYDVWIEKEESEGVVLRNLINFLTQKSK